MGSLLLMNICRRSLSNHIRFNFSKKICEFHLVPIRQCSSTFLDQNEPSYEIADFSKDLKPYLKKRNIKTSERRFRIHHTPSKDNHTIIKCKNKKLNFYENQTYMKHQVIPLVSENWRSHKSVGDYFTLEILSPLKNKSVIRTSKPFIDAPLSGYIINILSKKNLVTMSEIQELAIPHILSGQDCLIAAETGTGKTLAYLLPIIHQVMEWKKLDSEIRTNTPFVLVITPNRELTEQIRDIVRWFKSLGVTSHKIVGGSAKKKIVLNPVVEETDILVSTPGILSKIIDNGLYSLERVRHVVLDEADSLLDDSFSGVTLRSLKKLEFCEDASGDGCQLTLCGATMPTSLEDILGENINLENMKKIKTSNVHRPLSHVKQKFLRVSKASKTFFLLQIAKKAVKLRNPLIVFCNHSETCTFISSFLSENGMGNICITGDLRLSERKGRFQKFQDGEECILVCTDVASRGLDTKQVNHVLNYDFPNYIVDYIHRCGRTGRLGSSQNCMVTNLIAGKNEILLVQKIETAVRLNTEFENVNPNIKRIIGFKDSSKLERALGLDQGDVED